MIVSDYQRYSESGESLEAERMADELVPRALPFTLLSTWEPRYEQTD